MANPLTILSLEPKGFQFIQEIPIAATPEKVWAALQNVGNWFIFDPDPAKRPKHILEMRPGGRWTMEFPDGTIDLNATVTRIEPNKLLRVSGHFGMSHLPVTTVLIFELQPEKGGTSTLLRLGQRTFGFLDAEAETRFKGGWAKLLPELKALAEK